MVGMVVIPVASPKFTKILTDRIEEYIAISPEGCFPTQFVMRVYLNIAFVIRHSAH